MTITGVTDFIDQVIYIPNGSTVASVSGGEVQIWDISQAGQGEIINIYDNSLPLAFTPDGTYLYTIARTRRRVSDSSIVRIWDVTTGRLVGTLEH